MSGLESAAEPVSPSPGPADPKREAVAPSLTPALEGGLVSQTATGWILCVSTQRSGAKSTELPLSTDPADITSALTDLFEQTHAKTRRCVLALDSAECFFTVFKPPASLDLRDRTSIGFELERFVPLDAESMVSDHWVVKPSNRIAAIAIGVDRHRDIVDAFETSGIDLVTILPRSLLVAGAVQEQRRGDDPFRLFLLGDNGTESLIVHPEGVVQWKQYSGLDEKFLLRESIGQDHEQSDLMIIAVGARDPSLATAGPISWCDENAASLLSHGARLAMQGKLRRWPNLRRDQLAPEDPLYAVAQPLRWLAFAAAFCCIALSAAAWYRGERIASAAANVDQQKRTAFREAFPGRRVPVLLMRTVRSDYSKALGSRGRGDELQLPTPATPVLADIFRGLNTAKQEGARFRLIDLNVEDGEVSLTVRARESVQIGKLARSLETAGFDVDPPASEQIEASRDEPASYQSTITAIWMPIAAETADKPEPGRGTP